MREILFRGKRVDNGEWVHGAYSAYDSRYNYYNGQVECEVAFMPSIIAYDDECFWYHVDPATVGQHTGLTDKHGKRIFEGDIVTGLFLFERSVRGVVTFRDGSFGVKWMRGNVDEFNAFTSCCNVKWEVIKNVADNPELLEGGVSDG